MTEDISLRYDRMYEMVRYEYLKNDESKCWFCGKKIDPSNQKNVTFNYGGYRQYSTTQTFFKDIPGKSLTVKRCNTCADIHLHQQLVTQFQHNEQVLIGVFGGVCLLVSFSPIRDIITNIIAPCLAIISFLILIILYRKGKLSDESARIYLQNLLEKFPNNKPFEYIKEHPAVKKAYNLKIEKIDPFKT